MLQRYLGSLVYFSLITMLVLLLWFGLGTKTTWPGLGEHKYLVWVTTQKCPDISWYKLNLSLFIGFMICL